MEVKNIKPKTGVLTTGSPTDAASSPRFRDAFISLFVYGLTAARPHTFIPTHKYTIQQMHTHN